MVTKLCKMCGKEFEAKQKHYIFCSKECYRAKEKIRVRNYYSGKAGKLRKRIKNIKTRYKIDHSEYLEMLQAQGNRCAICGAIHDDLFIDHCHKTNEVRGLLCMKCNSAIGFLNDDPTLIMEALCYILSFNVTGEI